VVHKPHHPHHAHAHEPHGSPTRRDFLSALICAAVMTPWAMGQQETQSVGLSVAFGGRLNHA
jgi:hypothetical protein